MLRGTYLGIVLLLSACGGEDVPATPDAGEPVDGPSGPSFVGRWRDLDMTLPESSRLIATFDANGTYTLTQRGSTTNGTWALEPDGQLTLNNTTGSYYLSEDRLVTRTLDPVGPVDGVIGTWRGAVTLRASGDRIEVEIALRADGSQTFTRRTNDVMTVWDGTYTYVPEGLVVLMDFTSEGADGIYLRALPGIALGDLVLERLPN